MRRGWLAVLLSVRCVFSVRRRNVAWTRSSSTHCSCVREDLFSLGGTPETSVLSRATENFRDALEEARGGADSCCLERQCENGTLLNFVRAVRGTDGHTEGTTSAELCAHNTCPNLRDGCVRESCTSWTRYVAGQSSAREEAPEKNGKPPGTADSELPRGLETQAVAANTPQK